MLYIIVFCIVIAIILGVAGYYFYYNADIDVIVAEIPNALTDEECDALIEYAKSSDMQPSTVIKENSGAYELEMDQRNSKTIWLRDNEHVIAQKMANLASYYTNLPITHQEKTQVVCYDVGGKFDAHYDAQYKSGASTRKYTCLVYLNDDYDGGTTEFIHLNRTIQPQKGKMIVFRNLDNHGQILPLSMHLAHAVKNNNKWICTKWVHTKVYS